MAIGVPGVVRLLLSLSATLALFWFFPVRHIEALLIPGLVALLAILLLIGYRAGGGVPDHEMAHYLTALSARSARVPSEEFLRDQKVREGVRDVWERILRSVHRGVQLIALRIPKPTEFRPLIFISHSARSDPSSHKQLRSLEKSLLAAGFDILLDETRLEGGEPWRNRLHTWMGHCHDAIVLLTEKALKSAWVLKEATILSWRQSLSPDFVLLPVYLGISGSDVRKSETFSPLNLSETQALKDLTPKALSEELIRLLTPLKRLGAKTPRRLLKERSRTSSNRSAARRCWRALSPL